VSNAAVLLTGLLAASSVFAAGGGDALQQLATDDSPGAGQRLTVLYHSTTDADQRFWLVQALAQRLRDRSDLEALEVLLFAAQEAEAKPAVRTAALRSLTVFDSLPKSELGPERLEKIEAAVKSGVEDPDVSVRDAASELERALKFFKDPDSRDTPPPPTEIASTPVGFMTRAAGFLKWVWILLFPLVGAAWAWAGAPVFDHETEEGRHAAAAYSALSRQYLFLVICGFAWVNLVSLVGGYGFFALAEVLGEALYSLPGGWGVFYLAAGFCVLLPASLAAAGFARRPDGNLLMSGIRSLPWAVVFSFVALVVFAPLEVFYRLFFRRPREQGVGSDWLSVLLNILDAGSFRSAHLAAAIAAREGRGIWPALVRVNELLPEESRRRDFGLSGFDPRFVLLCATPAMALLCSLVARGMPVRWQVAWPVIILGCAIWAWGVLSAVLFALIQTLSGVDAAARIIRAGGGGLPEPFEELEMAYSAGDDNE